MVASMSTSELNAVLWNLQALSVCCQTLVCQATWAYRIFFFQISHLLLCHVCLAFCLSLDVVLLHDHVEGKFQS